MTGGFLTSHAVAELIGVSPSTVLSWIDKGLLPAFRTPGGHRRGDPRALVGFLRSHQMPGPRTLLPPARRGPPLPDEGSLPRPTQPGPPPPVPGPPGGGPRRAP